MFLPGAFSMTEWCGSRVRSLPRERWSASVAVSYARDETGFARPVEGELAKGSLAFFGRNHFGFLENKPGLMNHAHGFRPARHRVFDRFDGDGPEFAERNAAVAAVQGKVKRDVLRF